MGYTQRLLPIVGAGRHEPLIREEGLTGVT